MSGGVLKSSGMSSNPSAVFLADSPSAPTAGRAMPASSAPDTTLTPRKVTLWRISRSGEFRVGCGVSSSGEFQIGGVFDSMPEC